MRVCLLLETGLPTAFLFFLSFFLPFSFGGFLRNPGEAISLTNLLLVALPALAHCFGLFLGAFVFLYYSAQLPSPK